MCAIPSPDFYIPSTWSDPLYCSNALATSHVKGTREEESQKDRCGTCDLDSARPMEPAHQTDVQNREGFRNASY